MRGRSVSELLAALVSVTSCKAIASQPSHPASKAKCMQRVGQTRRAGCIPATQATLLGCRANNVITSRSSRCLIVGGAAEANLIPISRLKTAALRAESNDPHSGALTH